MLIKSNLQEQGIRASVSTTASVVGRRSRRPCGGNDLTDIIGRHRTACQPFLLRQRWMRSVRFHRAAGHSASPLPAANRTSERGAGADYTGFGRISVPSLGTANGHSGQRLDADAIVPKSVRRLRTRATRSGYWRLGVAQGTSLWNDPLRPQTWQGGRSFARLQRGVPRQNSIAKRNHDVVRFLNPYHTVDSVFLTT